MNMKYATENSTYKISLTKVERDAKANKCQGKKLMNIYVKPDMAETVSNECTHVRKQAKW